MTGSEAAIRVKSRKPLPEAIFQIARGADDRVGDQMRQMRGHRQHLVVMVRTHR
jgi:hypothetical protein